MIGHRWRTGATVVAATAAALLGFASGSHATTLDDSRYCGTRNWSENPPGLTVYHDFVSRANKYVGSTLYGVYVWDDTTYGGLPFPATSRSTHYCSPF
ncbi:hypothetical protein [Amycolatopsis sp. NPDC004625]|uniref:hypothetical protein n=1 Tax=Amycolatopsis sp. NPDC004625 TaxID=3154670 RepID=UPI0033AC446B